MDAKGTITVAVEELAQVGETIVDGGYPMRRNFPQDLIGEERKLGHPTLLDGLEARAAGELYLAEYTAPDGGETELNWFMNFQSGRFHKEPARRPTDEQENNILNLFWELLGARVRLG